MAPRVWFVALPLAGLILGWTIRWLYARFQLTAAENEAERTRQDAVKEAEAEKKAILVEAKDQLIRERNQQEREIRERRIEAQKLERRVIQKEENLDNKIEALERLEGSLKAKEKTLVDRETALLGQEEQYRLELERISGLTAEEAKRILIQNMENEAKRDAQILINKIDQEAQLTAEKRTRDVLVTTMQRIATDVTAETTVTSVSLPSDEMKQYGVGEEQIARGMTDNAWRGLMQLQVDRARDMMISGAPLGSILTGRIGMEMRMIIAGGLCILSKLENVGYDMFNKRPVLRPLDWVIMLTKSAPFHV